MKVLVVGGAGYIGSFTVSALKQEGFEVVVFDSFETGHEKAIEGTPFYKGNLCSDLKILDEVFEKEKFDAVVHFAAYIEVGESVVNPQKYFFNNVFGTLNLLKIMKKHKVLKIVFSSTAAVYGEPEKVPISEDAVKAPTNPYGESKLMVEKILSWYAKAYGFSAIALRYFNAVGASLDGQKGQDYPRPTHLITRACEQALGKRDDFKIFGRDYKTPDGTCIRDYIHVLDLANAHVLALSKMDKKDQGFKYYNIGTGKGFSVKQVVSMVQKISGVSFEAPFGPRREGDPAQLVADSKKIRKELGFKPEYSDLKTIIESAWSWHESHPEGYKTAT